MVSVPRSTAWNLHALLELDDPADFPVGCRQDALDLAGPTSAGGGPQIGNAGHECRRSQLGRRNVVVVSCG